VTEQKKWCIAEGRRVRPKEFSHLIDCEECGRCNLGGIVGVGTGMLIVPRHTAAPVRYSDVERAVRMNEEQIRSRSRWNEEEQ
jgi:hypothetical protein